MKHQIRGPSIHVEQHGSGEPTVVFFHYWGGTRTSVSDRPCA
jgi:hypothetical protein